jgi:hypothetical protein
VDVIWLPICQQAYIDWFYFFKLSTIIFKHCVPIRIISIEPCRYFFFVKGESRLPIRLSKRFSYKLFLGLQSIILRRLLFVLDLFQILMAGIWYKRMRLMLFWFKLESIKIVKVRFDCISECIHEGSISRLFKAQFRKLLYSLGRSHFFKIKILICSPPVLMISRSSRNSFLWW